MKYIPTIGLEIHAELKTRTKMFCDSPNNPDETRPNANICPVCMAHPGTLPVINREAVRHILRVGSAVGGTLADFSEFDRKSYFYPDIPKGYQISQYAYPLIKGGELFGVAITRVHLEEDTARSTHVPSKASATEGVAGKSLVDFNRAGVPLMELVTEPVIHDAQAAGRFARELQLLLRTLGASGANLEKGEMRVEANVSVSPEGSEAYGLNGAEDAVGRTGHGPVLGTKVEIKNLNSFRSVERAIAHEVERQIALIESGRNVDQETRGWNEEKQETFHQRFKEGSADYRYFPEPDLPKLFLSEHPELSSGAIHASLPQLPWDRRKSYQAVGQGDLPGEYIEVFVSDRTLGELFDQTYALQPDAYKLIANYIGSDIVGLVAKGGGSLEHITPAGLAVVVRHLASGAMSSRGAKDALAEVYANGGDLEAVAQKFLQQSDRGGLGEVVDAVIRKEEKAVSEYRQGKQAALQYLVGQAMRESKGAGNPGVLRELLVQKLSKQ